MKYPIIAVKTVPAKTWGWKKNEMKGNCTIEGEILILGEAACLMTDTPGSTYHGEGHDCSEIRRLEVS